MKAAALYVDTTRTPYRGIPDVDCWGVERDAITYAGPWPVVAHPPCGPWSRLRHMCGPEMLAQEGLGPIAVEQVRRWGGVLEHPAFSRLWTHCGLPTPGMFPDSHGGYTIHVEQWLWGHRAVKPTWLYIVGCDVPPMPPTPDTPRPPSGGRAATQRDRSTRSMLERLPRSQRPVTPPAFAEWLVQMVTASPR